MRKFTKILSVFMAAIMLMTALCIPASAADEYASAKTVNSGSKVSFELKAKKYRDDGSFDDNGIAKIFKVELSKKGALQLDIISAVSETIIQVIDEEGTETFKYSEKKITSGKYYSTLGSSFGANGSSLHWDKSLKKSKATLKYELEKGTYYIKVCGDVFTKVEGKTSITFTYPQATKAEKSTEITSFTVTLKKGSTLQLGTILSGEGTVKWSTSKKAVATVSSKGKVTAKGKGTAVITAKAGDSSMKITIKVTG